MSKKAEEKALKEYPVDMTPLGDDNRAGRDAYVKGYEQAEKDTIEHAAKWLMKHLTTNVTYNTFDETDWVSNEKTTFIDMFRMGMEE